MKDFIDMRRVLRRIAPWSTVALVTATLGVVMAPSSSTRAVTPVEPAAAPLSTNPPTTSPTAPQSPPNPHPPGPLTVDAAAWRGHGDLAFVSSGQLEVLSDAGTLTEITGPTGGGYDSNAAWSPDGQWLAFLHTGPADGYDVPAPTLWLAAAGSSLADEVTTSGVGMFAWSPAGSELAYTEAWPTNSTVAAPENLWFDEPGSTPVKVAVGTGNGVEDIAWSPDGSQLAFDDADFAQPATPTSPAMPPEGRVGVISAIGGPIDIAYELNGSGVRLAGWWPQGGGLLFWEDPGFAESADGQMLYSLASESHQPVPLIRSLVGPTWWAPEPGGHTVAVVEGEGRSIWSPGRDVDLCTLPAATCRAVAIPAGSVGLAPSWSASGALVFATASGTGPFGAMGGAFWSTGWMAQWDTTNKLWTMIPGGQPSALAAAPAGALLAAPSSQGGAVVLVKDDALWLAAAAGTPAVAVAGPLYSTAAPSGYYGEVDWACTFSWSLATGARQGSAQLLGEALADPEAEAP